MMIGLPIGAILVEIVIFVLLLIEKNNARASLLKKGILCGLIPVVVGFVAPSGLYVLVAALPALYYINKWDQARKIAARNEVA